MLAKTIPTKKYVKEDGFYIDITPPYNIGDIPSLEEVSFLNTITPSQRQEHMDDMLNLEQDDTRIRYIQDDLQDFIYEGGYIQEGDCENCVKSKAVSVYKTETTYYYACKDCNASLTPRDNVCPYYKGIVRDIATKNEKTNFGFGSILDWVPIYRDDEYNAILYNVNKESDKFDTLGLMIVDNHGRLGYFSINISLNKLLKTLLKYHEKIKAKEEKSGNKSWDTAIYYYCRKNGTPTYYG